MKTIYTVSLMILIFISVTFTSGCISDDTKTEAMNLISPIVLIKGSSQYCAQYPDECKVNTTIEVNSTIASNVTESLPNTSYVKIEPLPTTATPVPTVTVEPTSSLRFVNPYEPGQRLQGQWYKWTWPKASGLETANRGIVVYGHSYHDSFTQWNDAWGNYQTILPPVGQRFLAVYVHQEDFGPDDSGLWGYDDGYFNLQYNLAMHKPYDGYDKVFRIIELEDSKSNYYSIERLRFS